MEEIKTEEFEVTEADHKKIIQAMTAMSVEKARFSDFVRFKDKQEEQLKAAYENALQDLKEKKAKMLSTVESTENTFRVIYNSVFEDVVPANCQARKEFIYDDSKKAFCRMQRNVLQKQVDEYKAQNKKKE